MKAVLWDLDDTLLDTLAPRMAALSYAYEKYLGAVVDAEALWRSHRGGTIEDMGRRLVGDDYMRFVDTYRDHYYNSNRRIRPFEGIEETLAAFKEHEIPLAVVTSKISWGAVEELTQTGLLPYFAAVVGFDDTDLHKPDAEPVLHALDRLVLEPSEEVYMVGDSPADMFAALNAGCTSVAATWGTMDEELLLDASPRIVARHPADVLGVEAARAAI